MTDLDKPQTADAASTMSVGSSSSDGGPAFPMWNVQTPEGALWTYWGMSMRDWFAAHCPDNEIPKFTIGDIRKRFNLSDREYGTDAQHMIMKCEARYAYADAMLVVRANGQRKRYASQDSAPVVSGLQK